MQIEQFEDIALRGKNKYENVKGTTLSLEPLNLSRDNRLTFSRLYEAVRPASPDHSMQPNGQVHPPPHDETRKSRSVMRSG